MEPMKKVLSRYKSRLTETHWVSSQASVHGFSLWFLPAGLGSCSGAVMVCDSLSKLSRNHGVKVDAVFDLKIKKNKKSTATKKNKTGRAGQLANWSPSSFFPVSRVVTFPEKSLSSAQIH